MHGHVKVRMSVEQEAQVLEAKRQSSKEFACITEEILAKRNSGDLSYNVMEKVAEILVKAPEWSTLWNYRREILLHPKNDDASVEVKAKMYDAELDLTSRTLLTNPKSYATWNYRAWIMDHHPSPDWKAELALCNICLKSDDRNFHCWDHRRYVVKRSKTASVEELDFTSLNLEENFSNYSAWHYRSGLIGIDDLVCTPATPVSPPPAFDFKFETNTLPWNELDLVHNAVFTDPKDQGPWFYYWWLLGRGENNSYLREVYLSRYLLRAVLVFTSQKLQSAISHLHVDVVVSNPVTNEVQKYTPNDFGGWHSALDDQISSVWWLELPKEIIEACLVSVTVHTKTNKNRLTSTSFNDQKHWLYCQMEPDQHESLTRVALDPRRLLNLTISPVHEPSNLMGELDTVRELTVMEPENKWALLTLVSLLRYIRPENAKSDIESALKTLLSVDSQRMRYYTDMASAHCTEDALVEAYSTNSRTVNLSSMHMSRICYLDWFTLMTELNFSNNNIDILSNTFAYLVCLKDLNLDDNHIYSLKPLAGLPQLKRLSICRNSISDFDGLEPALSCPILRDLDITGNKVASLSGFTTLLAEHPGSKRSHRSLNVIYDKPCQT